MNSNDNPGALSVPLQALHDIAVHPSPSDLDLDAELPDDQATAVRRLFAGNSAQSPDSGRPDDNDPAPDNEPDSTTDNEPPAEKEEPVAPAKASALAEQLMRLRAGGARSVVDPADFETDEIFQQVFSDLDRSYDYQPPENFTSPGKVEVRRENTTVQTDAFGDDTTESVLITWPALRGRPRDTTLYRVLVADHEVEAAPGAARELIITHGTAFRDENPATSGFRHYMVWAYTWDGSIEGLLSAQALFIGEDVAIFPPRNFKLAESGGIVTGSWDSLPGHKGVRVYYARRGYAGRLETSGNQLNSGIEQSGFTHRVENRGLTYDFCLTPEIEFRGQTLTGARTPIQQKLVSADIQQVELTSAELVPSENEDNIMLAWTAPPTGFVRIFLTNSEPNPELSIQAIDKDYLEDDDALGSAECQHFDNRSAPGEPVMTSRNWPADWHHVYITPVNIVEERAFVGESAVLQKVDELEDTRLIERVSNQLITFDWPGGADFVDVQTQDETRRLEYSEYRRQGGIRLKLSNSGEKVSLTPKAIYDGLEEAAAAPAVIDYPGLQTYSYDLDYSGDSPRLRVWSIGHPDARAPHFRLVYRPDRLPLSFTDGDQVFCMSVQSPSAQYPQGTPDIHQTVLPNEHGQSGVNDSSVSGHAEWWVDARGREGGYLRLFIDPQRSTPQCAPATAPAEQDEWGRSGADTGFAGISHGAFGGSLDSSVPPATTDVPSPEETERQRSADVTAVIIEKSVAERLQIPRPIQNGGF